MAAPGDMDTEDQDGLDGEGEEVDFQPPSKERQIKAYQLEPLLAHFANDCQTFATHFIRVFFADRQYHAGGTISDSVLCQPNYVDLVLNTSLSGAIIKAYELLQYDEEIVNSSNDDNEEDVKPEMELVMNVQRECFKKGIPKCLSGGITLIYLEQCRGLQLPSSIYSRSLGSDDE